EYVEAVERSLTGLYYREKMTLRGNSGAVQTLYFRAATFSWFFAGRQPEFDSTTVPKAPAEETP
ncbi:MAG TPA: hypothetical protein VF593_00260, partial [Chthoniobacteraceae bacterium]